MRGCQPLVPNQAGMTKGARAGALRQPVKETPGRVGRSPRAVATGRDSRRSSPLPRLPLPLLPPLPLPPPPPPLELPSISSVGSICGGDERPAAAPPVAPRSPFATSSEVVVMILGGGPGNELRPLTDTRAEPAMPFAGFRLIDIPISNCLNSGLSHIYVLAQFQSTSLNRHISRSYGFVNGNLFTSHGDGFVEVLHATQRPGHDKADAWFQGTADAVRHFMEYLESEKHSDAQDVLILSGDQLYRMDFTQLIDYHRRRDADVTIATTPADEDHALHLGILKVDDDMNVEAFEEKPPEAMLHTMSMDTHCYGLCTTDAEERPYVASMGIYVFKKKVLLDMLGQQYPGAVDFSRDILPAVLGERRIVAYPHTSYFEDVGSLRNYYRAHMSLARGTLKLPLCDKDRPLYTEPRMLPPTQANNTRIEHTMMGEGCRVVGSSLRSCVVGACTYIDHGCDIQDTILFGADEYQLEAERAAELAAGGVPLGVGAGATLRRAIVDRNARIGAGAKLLNAGRVREAGAGRPGLPPGVVIREGLIIVTRDALIPPGTVV